ncbi:phosphohydrolase [Brumimicrobium salinarum]|uniref:Phosphohydrolase n=1 Tax=Brumimicrobium salinarum TaxID=2058658 RepID=A0A2I0R1Y0_9FLAO|nr:HD domain-containing protein [Brumimicrobium salinarum]PKR80591.1 phosphohydrolase [Brumimicrobium salinarum]
MHSELVDLASKIKKQFEGESTGHDWYHIDRVRKLALTIQKNEGGNALIVEAAALLHDVSDHKFNGGDFLKGGEVAKLILENIDINEEFKQQIVDIVNKVSFKGSGEKDEMKSLEGKIVQDADRIDALGAIGIARTFAYGGSIGQMIYDPEILPQKNQDVEQYINERTHTINHFYEKLLLLEGRMHTSTGKEIARKRTDFMKTFLNQFYEEWKDDV